MPEVIVEWRIAGWAENIMAVLTGVDADRAFFQPHRPEDVLDRAARLEKLRLKKSDKALNEWMTAYREEHAKRIAAEQKAKQERSLRLQLAKGENHEA